MFSASFHKINEEAQRSDENESFNISKIIHDLTESDIKNIDVEYQLENQIQIQETKESGWMFDKKNSMNIRFFKTGGLNRLSYVKVPLRSNAILNFKRDDEY